MPRSIPKTDGLSPTNGGTRTKVKTGCRTCKIRKVKCDEARPACKRCESTGRSCEGYGIWGGGSRPLEPPATGRVVDKAPCPPSTLPNSLRIRKVTDVELRSFEWFIGRSVFKLPGLFVPRFWKSTLKQACMTEPAVLDAVLALSTIHKSETIIDAHSDPCAGPDADRFVLVHYSKAMRQLRPDPLNCDQDTLRVTIMACVVFVYIELLRGHYQAALTHLHHGLRLMQQLPTSTTTHYRIQVDQGDSILDWAVEPLLRLYLQVNLLGQLPEPLHPAYDGVAYVELPPAFNSLFQARCYLDLLLSRVIFLFHGPRTPGLPNHLTKSTQYFSESRRILSQLRVWFASANATMAKIGKTASLRDRITFSSQLNFYIMGTILTEKLSQPSEMAYDAHTAGFITLLERSIEMFKASTIPGIRQALIGLEVEYSPTEPVVDMGWLPGLYFVAVHCRIRRIRHHAIRLIHTNAHKEGIWDTELTAAIAEEVARIEDSDFFYPDTEIRHDFKLVDVPRIDDLDDEPTLPEWCRVRDLSVRLPDDPAGVLTLTFDRQPSEHEAPVTQQRVYDLVAKRWRDGPN